MENIFSLMSAHVVLILNTLLLKEQAKELKDSLDDWVWNVQIFLWGILLILDIVKIATYYF